MKKSILGKNDTLIVFQSFYLRHLWKQYVDNVTLKSPLKCRKIIKHIHVYNKACGTDGQVLYDHQFGALNVFPQTTAVALSFYIEYAIKTIAYQNLYTYRIHRIRGG